MLEIEINATKIEQNKGFDMIQEEGENWAICGRACTHTCPFAPLRMYVGLLSKRGIFEGIVQ